MNKTHLIILTLGIGGCLALTLMMGYFLKMQPDLRVQGTVAREFSSQFVPLLRQPPSLVIKESELDEGSLRLVVKVRPKATTDVDRMLARMSDFLWRAKFEQGKIESITIQWRDPNTGEPLHVRLLPPGKRRVMRLYGGNRRTGGGRAKKTPSRPWR
jgi:hypothetical protein